jgi:hypothetical protein
VLFIALVVSYALPSSSQACSPCRVPNLTLEFSQRIVGSERPVTATTYPESEVIILHMINDDALMFNARGFSAEFQKHD